MSAKTKRAARRRETWRVQWDEPHKRTIAHTAGTLDEVALCDGAERVFHAERMGASEWWIGLADSAAVWVRRGRNGKYIVTTHEGFDPPKLKRAKR